MSGPVEGCGQFEVAPAALTVEEAARVLRIGRTKAYALTREWRATGGKSGLPVADLGDALRVPVAQLEALLGAPLVLRPKPADPVPADANRKVALNARPATEPTAARTTRPSRHTNRDDDPTLPFAS